MERKKKLGDQSEELEKDEEILTNELENPLDEEVTETEAVTPITRGKKNTEELKKVDLVEDKPEQSNLIWFKKVGGGSLRLPNKIIKPGEKVQLDPALVKPAWKDVLVPLESIPVSKKENPIILDAKKSVYKLKQRAENSPWWDVVDVNGKVLNDKALRKEKAEEYIRDMMQ